MVRAMIFRPKIACVIWFTGLSQSGKTTNSNVLQSRLESRGYRCAKIDGDILRRECSQDLGFSQADRYENTRRAAQLAVQYAQNVQFSLASFISPYKEQRRIAREIIGLAGLSFIEVYCSCPLEQCEKRDTKGYYEKARNGEIINFTGVTDSYEEPERPDITLLTGSVTVEENADKSFNFLKSKFELL